MTRALAIICVLFAAACQSPTELLLVVQTDLDLTQLAYVEIATSGDASAVLAIDDDGGATQPCICVSPAACPGDAVPFPLTVPLEPGSQGTTPFQVAARAHGPGGCATHAFVEDSAVLSFVPHERLGVYLALSTHCIEVTCAEGQTCDPLSGACMSNMTTGTKIDLDASPSTSNADAAVDLATSDMGPAYFTLAMAPDGFTWDVASNGSGFELIVQSNGVASHGAVNGGFVNPTQVTGLAGDTIDEVCVSSRGQGYVYGGTVAGEFDAEVFTYDPLSTAGISQYGATNPSQLQCKEDSNGVTVAWIQRPNAMTAAPKLQIVRQLTGGNVAEEGGANADRFVLDAVPGATPTILLHPATSPLIVFTADMAGTSCPGLQLYQLTDETNGFVTTVPPGDDTSCIALSSDAVADTFGVAALGNQILFAGEALDQSAIIVGEPASIATFSSGSVGQLAMAPLQTSVAMATPSVIVAVAYEPAAAQPASLGSRLYVARVQAPDTIATKLLLSQTADVSQPVKIAVDQTTREVLVTWIEPGINGSMLVGQVVTP